MNNLVLFTHIDLDGYGASVIIQKLYGGIKVHYVDYGFDENPDNLEIMKSADVLIFTDISVSEDTAKMLNEQVASGKKVLLIDHHQSALDRLGHLNYDWIHIDTSKSGTLLTYEYYKSWNVINPYKKFATLVNDYDLWIHDDPKSKLLQFLWSKDREYFVTRFLRNASVQFSANENLMVEDSIKEYDYSYELAKSSIDEYVDCEGLRFGLVKQVGLFASLVADKIMKENPHIDYLVLISGFKLSLSFRSLRINVREIAEKLGGGGHDLASGAGFNSLQDIVESIKQRKIVMFDLASKNS